MTLQDFAKAVAEGTHPELAAALSGKSPYLAVLECARKADAVTQDVYDELKDLKWWDDFAPYVAPRDPLVRDAAAMKQVPAGAILAFISVDRPVGYFSLGRRHLLHTMISLGDGKAVGCRNDNVVTGARADWSIIDLAEHLNWIDRHRSNGYDVISTPPLGARQAGLVRLRYRMASDLGTPSRADIDAAATVSILGTWGRPDASATVADSVIKAASAAKELAIDDSTDHTQVPCKRVNFRFYLDPQTYETFFNSPNEMRGQYFTDAWRGEVYVRELLRRIGNAIDWEAELAKFAKAEKLDRIFDREVATQMNEIILLVKASITAGKIWIIEKKRRPGGKVEKHMPATTWNLGQHNGHRITIPPNDRWMLDNAQLNWQPFRNDTRFEQSAMTKEDKEALEAKLTGASALWMLRAGGSYFRNEWPQGEVNVDVKGAWVTTRGEIADFTPPGKHFRSHQIKWFGYT